MHLARSNSTGDHHNTRGVTEGAVLDVSICHSELDSFTTLITVVEHSGQGLPHSCLLAALIWQGLQHPLAELHLGPLLPKPSIHPCFEKEQLCLRGCARSKTSPERENAESLGTDASQVPLCHWTCDEGNAWPHSQGLSNEEANKRAWMPSSGSGPMLFEGWHAPQPGICFNLRTMPLMRFHKG